MLKKTERFRKVANAELVLGILGGKRVLYFEEKPLLMAFSIRVYFDEEIVALHNLLLGHLAPLDVVLTQVLGFNPIQVTAFKHRAEDELL